MFFRGFGGLFSFYVASKGRRAKQTTLYHRVRARVASQLCVFQPVYNSAFMLVNFIWKFSFVWFFGSCRSGFAVLAVVVLVPVPVRVRVVIVFVVPIYFRFFGQHFKLVHTCWLLFGCRRAISVRAACLLSGYKFLIDNMRQACELAYVGLVKLLIVAYCYVDCPANTAGLAGAVRIQRHSNPAAAVAVASCHWHCA